MDSVPAGRTEWPLHATGVDPTQVVEGTAAADAVTATFTYANLRPKRLTGRYEFTHEAAASVGDLEQALRRDLADAIKSKMSNAIINGAAVTNAAATTSECYGLPDGACRLLATLPLRRLTRIMPARTPPESTGYTRKWKPKLPA